ncbi:MAG: hypothetical protein BWY82_01908 [Verrucomicrobia bacterium ADurb.Bin474]|nr:MAG: hypothetical protein BWY82_01908 [Verrucomicrobia bacterium ADurb.Bin474]
MFSFLERIFPTQRKAGGALSHQANRTFIGVEHPELGTPGFLHERGVRDTEVFVELAGFLQLSLHAFISLGQNLHLGVEVRTQLAHFKG